MMGIGVIVYHFIPMSLPLISADFPFHVSTEPVDSDSPFHCGWLTECD